MNKERIKQIIQYTIAVASQEDDFHERKLGPIHFIKYVYLVDMEYAKHNNGKTFTGIEWRFHNFGPWSNDVNSAIEPALNEINAVKEENASKYSDDDYIRWELSYIDRNTLSEMESKLNLTVKSTLKNYVHKFKNNTSALLHCVYATLPMIYAAPGEFLDFSVMQKTPITIEQNKTDDFIPYLNRLSTKQKRTFQSKMDELKNSFQQKLKKKRFEYKPPPARYDAVFKEGVEWLDSLAGENLPDEGAIVLIDESVWKSEARRGNEQ